MSKKIYITADEIQSIFCFREEQETAINWFRDDEIATVCTSDPTMITKLKNVMKRDPENYKCYYYDTNIVNGSLGNYFFEMPKQLLTFRVASNYVEERTPMSEEARAIVKERLNGGRKNND